jgi:streptogramin lyase
MATGSRARLPERRSFPLIASLFASVTGKVTEYPPPAVGNGMRELNNDPQGRMWWASPGNNTVGYLSPAKK